MAGEASKPVARSWHSLAEEDVLRELGTCLEGLTFKEAEERLKRYGYNELAEARRRTALQLFLGQFKNVFILLLISAALFSAVVGYFESLHGTMGFLESYTDALTIAAIVFLFALTGFFQEYRAEKALEALRKLTAPKARVIRGGKTATIPSRMVVPGDIILLEPGDRIPADGRLVEAFELRVDESVLTGESTPVEKRVGRLDPGTPVSERCNMVFSATHVVYGRGKAVVVATGMDTEFGRIAGMVQEIEEEKTPLERRLDRFAGFLARIVVAGCIVIFALEALEFTLQGYPGVEGFLQAFMSSIALAISAVPEGLPAIVAITLALGARELARRNAVLRRLATAETLGAVTVICSDKTGTLTKGEMTVRRIYVEGEIYEVTGVGYEPKGEFYLRGSRIEVREDTGLGLILKIGALCNNASLTGEGGVYGDPTEAALIVVAEKAGFRHEELKAAYRRIDEIPFTSERKRMTTIHLTPEGERIAFVKGAPEVIVERCSFIFEAGSERKLTEEDKNRILRVNEEMAREGLRVLGIAYRRIPRNLEILGEEVESNLVFVGLEGMLDPPREEAVEANAKCRRAGIKTVMITGDHRLTALAIAREIGIYREGDLVLTGRELDEMSDEELEKIVDKVSVYARVSPEHKLKIVRALKARGHIVAMTGDGVNDAPAVKAADIGVAMGITGTDVTKEASDLVLTDDNFATIVRAVEYGRIIYDNIRKYVRFLIACNFSELLVIGAFAVLGGIFGEKAFPLPLLPAMILWINLVTDGGPAAALATDPPEEDVMDRPPRSPEEGILHGMTVFILASFLLKSAGTFLVFALKYYVWPAHGFGSEATLREARTAAFVQAAMFELFVVWNCRSEKRSVWRLGWKNFSNRFLVVAEAVSLALTLGICYIPLTQELFDVTALTPTDLLYVVGVSSWGLFVLPEVFMNRDLRLPFKVRSKNLGGQG